MDHETKTIEEISIHTFSFNSPDSSVSKLAGYVWAGQLRVDSGQEQKYFCWSTSSYWSTQAPGAIIMPRKLVIHFTL
jgi:hypothetical protein